MRKIENKSNAMKYVELSFNDELEVILQWLYVEENLGVREVADLIGVHFNTVHKWLKMANIEMRLPHEKMLDLIKIKQKLKEMA